jgi:hypothetical protein
MTNVFRIPKDLDGNPDIRIIGPRRSGKTTFMAALAHWPNADPNSPIQSVEPFDDDTGELINMAQNILENGMSVAGTDLLDDPDELPLYTLLIELKPPFLKRLVTRRNVRFQVSCREYSGEIIKDLRGSDAGGMRLSNYLDDCASASGLLLLIDGTAKNDREYSQAFANLQRELNIRLTGENRNLRSYRLAVVFTKCEK